MYKGRNHRLNAFYKIHGHINILLWVRGVIKYQNNLNCEIQIIMASIYTLTLLRN